MLSHFHIKLNSIKHKPKRAIVIFRYWFYCGCNQWYRQQSSITNRLNEQVEWTDRISIKQTEGWTSTMRRQKERYEEEEKNNCLHEKQHYPFRIPCSRIYNCFDSIFYTNRRHYHWITSKYTVLFSSTLCKCSKCKFLRSMSLQFILFVCNSLPILNLGSYRYLVTYYKLEFIRILTVDLQSSSLPFRMIVVCVLNFSSAFVCSSSFENHINFICFATCKYTRQNMSLTVPSKSNHLLNFFL